MVNDSDPRLIWRCIGRSLDRHYPPEQEQPDSIEQLMEALRQRERKAGQSGRSSAA